MNPESQSRGELTRPSSVNPPVVITSVSGDVIPTGLESPAATAGSTGTSPIRAMSILRALRRRQTLALSVAILAAGISGPAAWFAVPRAQCKAHARLQVSAQVPKVLYKTVETESLNGGDYRRYQTTQLTLVKSQLALNAALRDKEVSNYRMIREQIDPISWLQENLKVEFFADSEVMEVSLSGDRPEELAGIVNAVTKGYMEEAVNVDLKGRIERHDKLKKLKEHYEGILKERRRNLRNLAETVGSDDKETLALRLQYALEHLAHVTRDLEDVQSEKRKALSRLKTQPQRETEMVEGDRSISEAEIKRWIDGHPDIIKLFDQLAEDEALLNQETERLTSISRRAASDPMLRRLRVNLKAAQKPLKTRRAELRRVAIEALREKKVSDQVARSDLDKQSLAMLEDLEQRLNVEIKTITDGNQVLTNKTLDLQSDQDDIAQLQHLASQVVTEVEALNVELGAPPRIRPIEAAVPPRTRDEKKRLATIAIIVSGAFFGSLFGIAFLELLKQKVDSADEVPTDLGLRVVGTVPIVRPQVDRAGMINGRSQIDRDTQNRLLESIDATRTMLVHAARTGSHRVVVIMSAVGGEGKTSLSCHLASSLARIRSRTLLIDADLRSPAIHRRFSLPPDPGLSEVLRGEVALADAISSTVITDLSNLTAGKADRQTIQLLAEGSLGTLFAELKEQFDFVIVDTSPILLLADGLLIAQHADAVLFSIYRDVSSKTKVSAAVERLGSLGVRILGAVVTGAHGGRYGSPSEYQDAYSPLPESAADSSDPSEQSP
jgi:capsular exopolysaccharide synthesis family protein